MTQLDIVLSLPENIDREKFVQEIYKYINSKTFVSTKKDNTVKLKAEPVKEGRNGKFYILTDLEGK